MVLLLGFAFLAGFVTILAPCIWPVLPIILSSSIAGGGGHKRAFGIVLGLILSFTIFTLFAAELVRIFHFDTNSLRLLSVIILAFLGITMIIPTLSAKLEGAVSKLTNLFGHNQYSQGGGFLPGFITGLALGIVWSPCAGPILATVATLAATQKVTLDVVLVTLAYVIGIGIPLFIFAYGGQYVFTRTRSFSRYTGRIQQIFGVIILLAAVAIYTNYDQTLQLQLLDEFPQLGTAVNGFENSPLVTNQLNLLKGNQQATQSTQPTANTADLFNANTPAPDFVGITKWLNTDKPLSIQALRGKVVLVDFWTYTCINCIRTLPFLTNWYDKYKDQGFVVIGVHTPEFQFEHETNNVLSAIKMDNIHYPVAQDNNYDTWNNYKNEYWPAEYLIDAQGNIRRTHFGEGEYDKMEEAIQTLLKESGKTVATSLVNMPDQTPTNQLSPETYLGSNRMMYYYPNGKLDNGTQTFTLANNLAQDTFSFGGQWTISNEYATEENNAMLNYNFNAGHVYLILRPGNTPNGGTVKVYLDGKVINAANAGSDVHNGIVKVDADRLYNIVDLHGKTENHILKFEFQTPGLEVFTFTFG